jgi:hypothetical protein
MSIFKDTALLLLTAIGFCAFFAVTSFGSITVFGDWHALIAIIAAAAGFTNLIGALWSLRYLTTERDAFVRRLIWCLVDADSAEMDESCIRRRVCWLTLLQPLATCSLMILRLARGLSDAGCGLVVSAPRWLGVYS